ncbi:uncharacterized protein PAC_15723 [Phialocephala subalpina]|uniref:Uncharacterized protein n=1 Tax=Phialocephala subalpina TaxID=576137 RepID=A0A1L7XLC7_9HELO|nr:uncharacterized protein PAC_15723 [Phialocephala subalpina]
MKTAFGSLNSFERTLDQLVAACNAREGLDPSAFMTDFHPQNHGILDVISQVLLPSFKGTFLEKRADHRGITAKLNGMHLFKALVLETLNRFHIPNDEKFLGRLVVCIAHPHQGGGLGVTSGGGKHSTFFQWSDPDPNVTTAKVSEPPTASDLNPKGYENEITRKEHAIKDFSEAQLPWTFHKHTVHWAAFDADREFQMKPLHQGCQIFLSYDLVVTDRCALPLPESTSCDPILFPLFVGLRDIVERDEFMQSGGTIEYYCQHKYSHADKDAEERMPFALKGVNLVLYSLFLDRNLDTSQLSNSRDLASPLLRLA